MITIKDAKLNIGRKVIYLDKFSESEEGIISSVNDKFIFVRYGAGCTAQATLPENLMFLVHY